ncbi:MAG: 50S ribosomal protein L6 [Waddliaceae bacterium]
MARKANKPIQIPKDVDVKFNDSNVSVKGPKGLLQLQIENGIKLVINDDKIVVESEKCNKEHSNFIGLYHSLVQNMIEGTTKGYEVVLEMEGVGFRAAVQGQNLSLQVGFSHPTLLPIPQGIEVKIEKNTKIFVSGIDKRLVGQFAANVSAIKPPEPYLGKGIRKQGQYVRRKAGKSAAKK